jgi:transcription antitermination factor NusG
MSGAAPEGRCRAQVLPGLWLVKMDLTDEAYHLPRTPQGHRLSGRQQADAVTDAEAARILHQVQGRASAAKPLDFEVGEQVRVSDGRLPPSTARNEEE